MTDATKPLENPALRDLDATLAAEAPATSNGEGPAAGAVTPQEAPPAMANREALKFGLELFRTLVCSLLKVESPKETLSAENVESVAGAVAPVLDKYGISLSDLFGRWEREIAAVVVVGPIAWGAWKGLDRELRAKRAGRALADTGGGDSAGASSVDVATGTGEPLPAGV